MSTQPTFQPTYNTKCESNTYPGSSNAGAGYHYGTESQSSVSSASTQSTRSTRASRPSITIHAFSPTSVSLASEMANKNQNMLAVTETEESIQNFTVSDEIPLSAYPDSEAIVIRSVIDIADYGVAHGIPAMDVIPTTMSNQKSNPSTWIESSNGTYGHDESDDESSVTPLYSPLPPLPIPEEEPEEPIQSNQPHRRSLAESRVNVNGRMSTNFDMQFVQPNLPYAPSVVLVDDDPIYQQPLPQLQRDQESCSDTQSDLSHDVSTRDTSVSKKAESDSQNASIQRIVVAKQDFSDLGDITIDRYGYIHRADTVDAMTQSDLDAKYKERDVQRETKWIEMLSHWVLYTTKRRDVLKKRIRKGIPASLRGVVWPSLVGIAEAQSSKPLRYYQELLVQDLDFSHDIQIRKDLPRLSQDHVMFRSPEAGSRVVMCHGQASLYNVLKAYAIHDPKVGYVQGMDSVAVAALLYFPEDTAFWYLERLLNNPIYNLRELYIDGMPLAHKYMYIHSNLVRKYAPRVHAVLVKHDILPMSYAFRWYSMRYSQFDPQLSYRILDIYLYEGDKILYRVALALLQLREAELCSAEQSEEVMEILSNIERDHALHCLEQGDIIIDKAMSISVRTDDIIKYSRRYTENEKDRLAY